MTMANGVADRYRRWFEYEQDSHAKVLVALSAVPEAARGAEAYQQAVMLMAHIVGARLLWLDRFGAARAVAAAYRPQTLADFFPTHVAFADLAPRVAETQAAWAAYLAGLTDEDLAHVFEYQSLEGARFRNTVEDILTQLFGHSWYHRGQIALLLRSIGAQPAVTDLVFWTREPVESEPA
jgi:uncharacterized damage-inducible protein DinB